VSDTASEALAPDRRRALLRVVLGEPDDAEVAALTLVLAAAASAGSAAEPDSDRARGVWLDRQARLRRPLHPGPGSWKASTLPR
jgi:hypothetical protein